MNVLKPYRALLLAAAIYALLTCVAALVMTDSHSKSQTASRSSMMKPLRFLDKELGPATTRGHIGAVRHTTPGLAVRIQQHALSVTSAGTTADHVSLSSVEGGTGAWHEHAFGASRPTDFGSETIVVDPNAAEQLLTVDGHQGTKTWRWNLDTNLRPRLLSDGRVGFAPKHPGRVSDLIIAPVAIFDANGKRITPHGARWQLGGTSAHPTLDLRLNDADLPVPYVIDPAIHGAVSAPGALASQSSVTITKPASAASGDLLFASISVSAPTATTTVVVHTGGVPWTLIKATRSTTNVALFTFYRIAGSSEPASYQFDIQDPAGTSATKTSSGGIAAYTGVYNGAPLDAVAEANSNGTAGTSPQVSGVTTSGQDRLMIYAVADTSATITTQPFLNGGALMTSRWNVAGNGVADMVESSRVSNLATTFTALSVSNQWAAQVISFVGNDAAPSIRGNNSTTTGGTAASIAVTAPTGLTAGDVMVAGVDVVAPTATTVLAAPSGWTAIRETRNGTSEALFTYYKVATSSEPASYTWSVQDPAGTAASKQMAAGIEAYYGIATTNTLDTSGTAPGYFEAVSAANGTAANVPGVGTAGVSRMSNYMVGTGQKTDITTAPSLNGVQMTIGPNVAPTGTKVGGFGLAWAEEPTSFTNVSTAGTVLSGSSSWAAQVVSLVEDKTAPTQTLSVTEGTNPADQFFNSTTNTIYYNTAVGGDFTIASAPSDSGGTLDWVSFPDISVTGFTGQGTSVGAAPYTSGTYSWTTSNAAAPTGTQVSAFDTAGNHGDTALTFVRDVTAGTTTVQFPANNGIYNAAGFDGGSAGCTGTPASSICGTVTDAASGISQVQLSIQKDTGNYWNGTSFGSATEVFQNATLTSSNTRFSYPFDSTKLADGSTYTIHIKSTDNVNNVESQQTVTFTYDSSAPSAATLSTSGTYNSAGFPASLTGTTSDSGTGGHGISAVKVSIKDSTSTKCWNGTNFTTATCPNWIAVTSGGTATGSANANWSYSTTGMGAQLTDGDTYTVEIQATDATTSGNQSGTLSAGTFTYDNSAPNTASLTTNGNYNSGGFPSTLTGSTSDSGTGSNGISAVNVSVKDSTSGKCWNSTNFTTAACPNWIPVTSGGTATGAGSASWTYSTTGMGAQLTNGDTYTVQIQATDATTNGNTSGTLTAGTFKYDTSAPTASITAPTNNTHYNSGGWPGISGTAADATSSVASVKVSIQKDGGANSCWDGTNAAGHFTAACPNYVAATGTTSWSVALGTGAFVDGSTYALTVQTTDNATNANSNNSAATASFVYDNSAPTAAISSPSNNAHYNSAGWPGVSGTASDTSSTVSSVKVSIQKDGGANSCWDGTNAAGHFTAACPNYVAATGTTSWSVTLGTAAFVDGSTYALSVQTSDSATNANTNNSAATATFVYDTSAPTASISSPANNGHYNSGGWPGVSGSASDATSSVGNVKVSIQKDGGANSCWDGTNAAGHFTAACPNYVAATGTTSWSITLGSGALVDGSSYALTVQTSDNATNANTNNSAATATFTYDTSAPTSAALSSNGNYNSAGWPGSVSGTTSDSGTGGNGISAVSVSIQKDGGASACWNGSGFTASCPNWVAVSSGASATGSSNANWSYTLANSALTNGSTYAVSVRATDATTNGNTSGTLSAGSFTYDTAAPSSATLSSSGSYNASGWPGAVTGTVSDSGTGGHGISAVNVSIQDSVSGKCWNGTNFTTSTCPNWVAVTSGGAATGNANASWSYTLASSALTDGHTYTVNVQATDNTTSGNTSGTLSAGTYKYDTTAPTHAVALNTTSGAFYSSGTLYYKGDAAGNFKFNDSITDATSGPSSVTYPAIATSGWTHSAETVGSGPNYTSASYSWNAGPTNPSGYQLSASDTAGNASTASITFASDTAGPSVTAPSVTAGYYTSLSVPVLVNGGTDSGSGVAAGTSVVQRDDVTLSNGACGSFAGSWTTVTLVGGVDTSVLNGHCYEYRERLTDNVGNVGSSGASNVAKVDNSPPANALSLSSVSGGAYKSSNTVYYRGSAAGSFKLTNAVTDSESGAASSATAALGGTTTGWTHTPSTVNLPAGGPYDSNAFSWSAGTSSSPTEVVTGADAAGNQANAATLTFTNDSTAPSVTAPTVTGGYYKSASVAVTTNGGSDSGSGLAAGSSVLQRDDTTLTNGTCGTFTGSWQAVTLVGGADTSVLNGHCYEYREQLTDHVGNVGSSSASNVAMVDTQGPANSLSLSSVSGGAYKAGTTVYYRGAAAGSFKLTNTVTDAESGPASSATAALGGTTTGWLHTPSTVSTPAGGPYDSNTFSWSAGTTSSPTETVTAADVATNTTAASALTFTNDSNAPASGALTVNGTAATGGGTTSVSATGSFPIDGRTDYSETQSGSESGLASSTLTRQSATFTNGSCGTFGTPTTISGNPSQSLATGCYLFTLTGTDNVGNTVSVSTTVEVDTSAPAAPTLTISNLQGSVSSSGTTVFYLQTSSGSFDITASSTDGDSGVTGYTFPTAASMGSGWSVSGTGATRTYSFTPGAVQPGTKTVTATNGVGSTAGNTFAVLYSDSTPAVSSIKCDGAACGSGYHASPTTITLSADDGVNGSGVQVIRYTLDGTDPTPVNGSDYTAAFTLNATTTVKFRSYDNAGNEEAVQTQVVTVDSTAPTGPTLTVTENPASGAQFVSGSTVFYRPGASGTFRVSASTADPETGIASVAFPSITNVTGGGSVTAAPYRTDYTWGASTSDSASHSVVASNGVGMTSSDTFTLTPDSTAPSGQTITLTGANAPYYKTASVTFSLGDGTDNGGGSGLDTSSRTVTRETAPLSGDSCGTFVADSGTFSSPDTSVADGNCYRYTFTIADNVGNVSSTVSVTAKVDMSAPNVAVTAPTEVTGAANQYFNSGTKTQYFRPTGSGSFTLNANASDASSAVTGVAFPDVSATLGWSGSTGGNDTSSPYASPANYTWSSGAVAPGAQTVTATDKAANTASDGLTIAADSTAPTGQTITLTGPSAPYYTTNSVTFSLGDGTDGGSGIDTSSRTVTRETGTLSNGTCSGFTADAGTFTSPDTAVSSGHCYRYTFTIADNVGNAASAVTTTAKVDTDAPALNLTAPTELTGTGNQYYDALTQTQYFRPSGSGSFSLNATASDGESGMVGVSFPDVSAVSGWSGSTGGQSTGSSPYASPTNYTWTSGAAAPAARSVVATNNAGLTTTAQVTIAADGTAPSGQSITLTGANAPYYGSASVTFSLGDGSDGGSGLDLTSRTVTRETAPLNGDSCGTFVTDGGTFTSPDTSVSSGHCYRYSFTIADNVGNVSTAVTATARVDTVKPSINVTAPTEVSGTGNQFYNSGTKTQYFRSTGSGSFTLNATASDADTAVTGVTFPDVSGTSGWSGSTGGTDASSPYSSPATYAWSAGASEPGAQNVTATDRAGNTQTDGITLKDDTTGPSGQTIALTGTNAPYYGSGSVTFSLGDGSDNTGGSGVDTSSRTVTRETGTLSGDTCTNFTADAGTFTSPDTSVTNGHCYRYTFVESDNVGNQASGAQATAKVDTGGPSATLTDPGTPVGGTVTLNASASDSESAVQQVAFQRSPAGAGTWTTIGTDTTAPYSTSWNTTGLTDGDYDLRVVATDVVGNSTNSTVVASRTVDNTAPDTTITAKPANPSNNTTPSFSFTSSETGSTFSCRIDNGSWASCSSPDTLSPALAEGSHTFDVRATDQAGNTDASPASYTWTVDTTAPNTTITAKPANPSNNTTPSFSFTSSETGSTFECRIDGGSWTTCTTPNTLSPALAEGSHTFDVRATDAAGNTDASPDSYTWTVDTTAPNTTITAKPANPSNNTTPSFSFSSTETGSTFQCRIDGGSWTSCTSPETMSPALAEGSHTFDVRATDPAGNTDASPATYTWTVDLTAPDTSFTARPADPSNNTTPSFSFTSTETGSTFECRVDAGAWSSCTSPKTVSPALAEGSHTFDVRATDQAGNTDASPASYTWTVDLTAPETTITAKPANPSNNTTPSFSFTSTETGSTFECRIDGGAWSTCTSPDTLSPALADGSHTFDVRATDQAGNTDASPASYTWTVDTAAPNTTITARPSDPSNNTAPSFSFTSTETGSTFECRIDAGSWTACTSPDTISPSLGAGSHTFDVRATDPAGNTDATPASYTWTIDLTAPDTSITARPSDPSGNASPSFSFTSTETGSTFECRIDGGSWTACSSPDTLSPALAEGSHTFDVRATDPAGNTDASPASYTWTVDLTAPNTTITAKPADPSSNTTPSFSFASTETGSTFECRIDAGSWATCTSPDTLSPALADGSHTFDVRATDQAGNTDASPASYTWTVDTAAPNTSFTSTPADPSNDPTPAFAFTSTETGSTFECRVDGGSWASCSSPHTISPALSAGSHTFDVRATDQAGNTDATPASYTWTTDFSLPNTTIDSSPPNPDNNPNPTFAFSSDQSPVTFECRIDGGTWSACSSPDTLATLGAGSHTFDVRAKNQAANFDPSPATYTWTIDLTAPSVTITAPTTYINASDPSPYTVTATTPDADVAKVDFYQCSNASSACSTGTWNLFDTDTTAPYGGSWTTPAFDGQRAIRAVATDQAGNTAQNIRTITIDRTAPTGVSVTYANGYAAGAVTITTNNGTDPDVNASSAILDRQTATLTNGSCGTFGSYSPVTSPDTVPSGECAMYRYRVADNAGNVATATSANVVKRDTAAPTSAVDDPGTNLRQTVTLTASASDTGGSGIASVAFQRKPSSGGSWTTIGSDTTSPYSVSFDTTTVTDGAYDFRTVATDGAGNAESSPVPVTNRLIDNAPPSATMLSPGNPVHGTVGLTSTTSDSGSGIASVVYGIAPHNGSFSSQPAAWDTTGVSDGLYDLHVVATDNAGNTTTSSLITTRVDNTAPAVTFSSPASGANVSGTVTLTASATDASPASPTVTFAYKQHGAPASAYTSTSSSWNTATLPGGDGLYDLRASAADDAGNITQVENTSILVDNVAPTVSITAPPVGVNASFASPTTFSANATDAGSGVGQVSFYECSNQSTDCSTGSFNLLGTDTTAPYSVSWNIPADGNRTLEAVAGDNAGHTSFAFRNVNIDTQPPDTAITGKPADPSSAASTFTFISSELGSTFECRIDGGSWTSCSSPKTLSGLTDGSHTFDVRSTDAAGNVDPTPDTWTWHRDATAPTGSLNNPGANVRGVVALTSNENDPPANGYASGIKSVAFEYSADGTTWAPIGTNNAAPFNNMTWSTVGIADGVYQLHIVVTDVAGNTFTSAGVTNVRIDNTPPTTSQDDPGTYLRGTKTLTGSAADAGSGVGHVDFQQSPAGANTWSTIGTATTSPYSTSFDTTAVADGRYDFRTVAVDVAGNQAISPPVTSRLVDNTPPNATMTDPSTAGGFVRGTLHLTSTSNDPNGSNGSGIASTQYEYSTNGGSTWTNTGATLNTASLPDGSLKLHAIVTDNAGNTTTSAAVTDTIDNTKPATTDNAPSGWQSSAVTVTLSASDSGSGVNVTEYSVDGGTYQVGTSVTVPAPVDGSNDGAHTIAYFSADNVGNVEQVKSATVLISGKPPACPSCGASDYLRGTVTLSASPTAGAAGIKSVTFQYAPAGGSTWTTIGTDTTGPSPYTVDWDTTPVPDGHYDLRILVTDNADATTTTNLPDKVVDNTPPSVATVGAPTEGAIVSGNVSITASAADVTSPIASVQFIVRGTAMGTDNTAPFAMTWDSTTGADGSAAIQVVVTDMAGNTKTSAVRTVTVDNRSPSPTLADPGQNLHGTVTLTATSDPDTAQVDFERAPAGSGSWTTIASDTVSPFSASLDTTALTDGLYDFRAVATDGTGNTGTSNVRASVRVDNTAPTGSLTAPAAGASVGGPAVPLKVSTSDSGSGIASVAYEMRPTGGVSFTQISSSSTAPFDGSWNTTGLSTGNYDLRPVITDGAGNTFTGAIVTVDVAVTAPTVSLDNPGATLSGNATLSASVTGSASQVAFELSAAGANAWKTIATDSSAPYSVSFNTASYDDGLYDFRAVATDSYGNTSQSVRTGIRIDNTAPAVVSSTPSDGATVDSAASIELVASETATPSNVTLDGSATVAPVVTGTHILYNTGALSTGLHALAGTLTDAAGKTGHFELHVTVLPAGSNATPPVSRNASAGAATTMTSSDGNATLTVPAGAFAAQGSDWLVVKITTLPETSGSNGFTPAGSVYDVTAHWALSGTPVTHFDKPLELYIRSTTDKLVPATFLGDWLALRRTPTAGTLASGWNDGFYRDNGGYRLLTLHLTQFTLLHDIQPPNAPTDVLGFAQSGHLVLAWTPGADNSGTYDFVRVLADGTRVGDYGPDQTQADIGTWTVGDQRAFTLDETDLAGNTSAPTRVLHPVPSLVGKTTAAASAALSAAGFHVGNITEAGTGQPGTVTGPANLAVAESGATINLTVAPGTSSKFVFGVVTAKNLKTAKRHTLAARVSLTRSAHVAAALYSPRGVKLFTWRFALRAGRSIVRLRLPSQIRRSGVYTIRWTATAGRERLARTIRVRLIGKGTRIAAAKPVEVVLAGSVPQDIAFTATRRPKVVTTGGEEDAYSAVSAGSSGVQVIVVDVDTFGVAFVRDLHSVFPDLKIVALSSSPKTMAAALKAGATAALPSSTPRATLAALIAKLLKTR